MYRLSGSDAIQQFHCQIIEQENRKMEGRGY